MYCYNVDNSIGITIDAIKTIITINDITLFFFLSLKLIIIFLSSEVNTMRISPFTPLFIIFIIWLHIKLKKSSSLMQDASEEFWQKEALANQTRKQPIENLDYICVDSDLIDKLSFISDDDIKEAVIKLKELSTMKILNLTGITNTELKLQYGAANLSVLSEYDQNFTKLVNLLYRTGSKLHELGNDKLAISTLEEGIHVGSDVSGNYILLAKLYKAMNMKDKAEELYVKATTLTTINKAYILDTLMEINSSI